MFNQIVDIVMGLALACAFIILWLRNVNTIITVLALQGACVGVLAFAVGAHHENRILVPALIAFCMFALKAIVLPLLLRRVSRNTPYEVERHPIVNVPTSLLLGAVLTMIAHTVTQQIARLEPEHTVHMVPLAFAIVLIGFLVITTRRHAINQVIGFLLLDNGITLVAILATGGLPALVDLGASFDVLLAVLVLQVLAARLQQRFGALELDLLRELHD